MIRIGVGWSTGFDRPWYQRLQYRPLKYAYRAPAFVVSAATAANHEITYLRFDESLETCEFDGSLAKRAEDVDLLYLMSHGVYDNSTYRVEFHQGSWTPTDTGIGASGPSVAVFDTCDLLDLNDSWEPAWEKAGPSLRLVLGFASPATVAENSSRRGQLFIDAILAGEPIAPAWLEAVHGTAYSGYDLAVAVAFGDDEADADWILEELTLDDLPRARVGEVPVIAVEACH